MQPIKINKQAVEADINVFKAKVALTQALIDAHVLKTAKESKLVKTFLGFHSSLDAYLVNEWERAYIAHSRAMQAIHEMDLLQLKQQIAIREAMIADGERNVVVPGAFKV
jgi:predicted nuclease of restriction endonuclease-like RecB superfamily